MKKLIFIAVTVLMLTFIPGCTEENNEKKDEWIQIDSIMPGAEIANQLNFILSKENECLPILSYNLEDTVFYSVFSHEDFEKIDTCHKLPEIDFTKYTLEIGEIFVPAITYKIFNINLVSNAASESYRFDISIDTCIYCYAGTDVLYFWRLYPKLQSNYEYNLFIKNTN